MRALDHKAGPHDLELLQTQPPSAPGDKPGVALYSQRACLTPKIQNIWFSKLLLKLLKCFLKTVYTSFDIVYCTSVNWAWVGSKIWTEQLICSKTSSELKDRLGGDPGPGVEGGGPWAQGGDLQGRQEEAVLSCKIILSESHLCLVLLFGIFP